MATPVLGKEPQRRLLRPVLRWAAALAVLLLLALVAAGLWFTLTAKKALPQLDGAVRVQGLSAPVTVLRDAQGVPHIRATTAEDLFFAQGFVTAQDRLWQLDMLRRAAGGELSEVL